MVRDGGDHSELGDVVPSGCDRGAQDVGGQRKFQRKQVPRGEAEPDWAVLDFAGLACGDRLQQAGYGLKGAESHDKHGAPLDDKRNVAYLETRAQAPQGGAEA